MTTPTTPETSIPLTKEQVAWLIRTLWAALQAPGWTFKNRKDLEKIGEALFTGKTLKDLDDALYERIFPHLVKIAEHLGEALRNGPQDSSPPKPATEPNTTDSQIMGPKIVDLPIKAQDPKSKTPESKTPESKTPESKTPESQNPNAGD